MAAEPRCGTPQLRLPEVHVEDHRCCLFNPGQADLDKTGLHAYYYAWGHDLKGAAIALGHGSLYNHSYQPNARYLKHLENGTIEFICLNDVKKGEEIRVNYNGDPSDQTPTWFETS